MRVITGTGPKIRTYIKNLSKKQKKNCIILPESNLDSFEELSFKDTLPILFDGDIITLSKNIVCSFSKKDIFILGKKKESKKLKVDINGESIMNVIKRVHTSVAGVDRSKDEVVLKNFHSIGSKDNKKMILFNSDRKTIKSIVDFPKVKKETLEEKAIRIQKYLDDISLGDILLSCGENYYYDKDKKSIIEHPFGHHSHSLEGNGTIKLFVKVKDKSIRIQAKFLPTYEQTYKVIPLGKNIIL